jgi:7-carboxy-7-deazaguanine synthase (Cx14CxxC type)
LGIDGVLGGQYDADRLTKTALSLWPFGEQPFIVCTGGEPLLQLDPCLVAALHESGCLIAVETNGTLPIVPKIDWICVSPKANTTLLLTEGNELKLVYPQRGTDPTQYESLCFEHFFLQPADDPDFTDAVKESVSYCMAHPKWRLSIQLHKTLGIK